MLPPAARDLLRTSDRDHRHCKVACATSCPFVVESTISEQEVNLEAISADTVESALDHVGFPLVAADVRERQCHRFPVGDDICGVVAVTHRGTVGWYSFAEFTVVFVGRAVIRVIDR